MFQVVYSSGALGGRFSLLLLTNARSVRDVARYRHYTALGCTRGVGIIARVGIRKISITTGTLCSGPLTIPAASGGRCFVEYLPSQVNQEGRVLQTAEAYNFNVEDIVRSLSIICNQGECNNFLNFLFYFCPPIINATN